MKILSIFIDESGDFGEYSKHSPFYIITMVMHNQDVDISNEIDKLNTSLKNCEMSDICIHTEPLIRKEESFANIHPNDRRAILTKLYYFALKININFATFVYKKHEFKESLKSDTFKLESKMVKDINSFIDGNKAYFDKFEKVILYYDNGQKIINRILNYILTTNFVDYEVRKVLPKNYKLFQVADLICTLELIKNKIETRNLSRSETFIFKSKKDFRRDFIKNLWIKKLN